MIIEHKGYKCAVKFGKYYTNNNTAIQLVGAPGTEYEGEVISIASVNGSLTLIEEAVGIKTWSENEGIVESLVKGNVIKPEIVGIEPTGYVHIEYYLLTEEAFNEKNRQLEEVI